ncbi:MAG: uroporphyrinogen decarboxylase family protein [Opitutaceae bacterium]|nr:uroporphyrinogen decarboxylase family protein [Opitutaceae bacterium]
MSQLDDLNQPNQQRLLATLRGEKTDRVPNFEILIEDEHVEKLLGRKAGNTLGVGGDPAKGSAAAEGTRPMYPADYIELCRLIGQDVIALADFWTPIRQRKPDGTVTLLNDRSFKTRADLERVIWPDEADLEKALGYVREYVAAAKGTNLGVVFAGACIWQTLYEFVIGLHDCLIMMVEEPELFDELMTRSADYYTKLVAGAIAAGVDIFYPADDFAYNKGLFVEPHQFERQWRPHYDRIFAPARQAQIPIWFHSDGKIDQAVEMLLEMGVSCITPMDPSGIDYRAYKQRYGHRVTLHGNVDITWPLVNGTPADVERDVKAHMDVLKPGGRWIAGSSHSIVNYIPHQNFLAMIEAIHRYGRY